MTGSRTALAALLLVAAAAALLLAMGRPPICTCGTIEIWVSQSDSPKTSQMLADWYSPSHVIHGFLFYGSLWLVAPRQPVGWRFLAALLAEIAWEILENTDWAINRYREATIAVGYTGDSILNTLSDVGMMALGFWLARRLPLWLARRLPLWVTVAAAVALELAALAAIRDNLTLNVWMFLWPSETVRAWQTG